MSRTVMIFLVLCAAALVLFVTSRRQAATAVAAAAATAAAIPDPVVDEKLAAKPGQETLGPRGWLLLGRADGFQTRERRHTIDRGLLRAARSRIRTMKP